MSIINRDLDICIIDILLHRNDYITLNRLKYVNSYFYNYIHYIKTKNTIKKHLSRKIKRYIGNANREVDIICKIDDKLMINQHINKKYLSIDYILANFRNTRIITKEEIRYDNSHKWYKIIISRNTDIISNFIISGINIRRIDIEIGGNVYSPVYYNNANLVSYVSHLNGLFHSCMYYHEAILYIFADNVVSVSSVGYKIQDNLRICLLKADILDTSYISKSGKREVYVGILYGYGMMVMRCHPCDLRTIKKWYLS